MYSVSPGTTSEVHSSGCVYGRIWRCAASSLTKPPVCPGCSEQASPVMGLWCWFPGPPNSETRENQPFLSKAGWFFFIISALCSLLIFPWFTAIIFLNNDLPAPGHWIPVDLWLFLPQEWLSICTGWCVFLNRGSFLRLGVGELVCRPRLLPRRWCDAGKVFYDTEAMEPLDTLWAPVLNTPSAISNWDLCLSILSHKVRNP